MSSPRGLLLPGKFRAQHELKLSCRRHIDLVRGGLDVDPAGLRAVLSPPQRAVNVDPIVLSASVANDGEVLGGSVRVTIFRDGSVRWQGRARARGGSAFAISAIVRASGSRAIALAYRGQAGAAPASGSRDHEWDEAESANPIIAASFEDFARGQLDTNLEHDSELGTALEKSLGWLVKWGAGTPSGPVGLVVFVGVELGSLVSAGSRMPGARLAEGVLWMAGPANTLFAIAAHGVAELGSQTRALTREEYAWANTEVFLGALPPRDLLVLADTIGGDGRAFTFPRFDGKITLNMGAAAFADPRAFPGGARGEAFIHELVHACQIHHATIDIGLVADALAREACAATGGEPHHYGTAGFDYRSLSLEQQAQVVSDWFVGAEPARTNHTGVAKDPASPYFRYVARNLRIGRF